MKVGAEELAEVMTLLGSAEEFRPVVREAIKVLQSYGPEADEALTGVLRWVVSKKIETVKQFEVAGFTREEAMALTSTTWKDIHSAMQQRSKTN